MKTTVIFHSADYDGIFCREIAKHFLGTEEVEYIGWNFGDPALPIPQEGTVYVLDLPCDRPFGFMFGTGGGNKEQMEAELAQQHGEEMNRFIWIDHHKSSIESHPTNLPGYRIDGVAACRLTWQWFQVIQHNAQNQTNEQLQVDLPTKDHFLNRGVFEPLAIRLAGEYDIWDKRDPRAETFQYALRAVEPNRELLLGENSEFHTQAMCDMGVNVQNYARRNDESICKHRSFLIEWEGLRWLCINTARFNSLFFASRDIRETGHDALLGFCWDGKCWQVSMYHAAHNTNLDLSEIAKKYGGGGHRGACGFTTKTLPLPL